MSIPFSLESIIIALAFRLYLLKPLAPLFKVGVTPLTNSSELNYLTIAGAGASPLVGTGVLLYMRFECISSGYTPANFNGGDDYNFFNEGTPALTLDNGSVNVSALPIINI